ncbi:DUF6279 family lipoprotein [Algicola sagamiensis]|uniref:DUF6279 family lipoprotein n=1 Tax=Algicola sagamiensis TaxID=163869 RepID=UPI000367751F|nr:DUF6279 family lipoprotein [Algicola sagamiensis]
MTSQFAKKLIGTFFALVLLTSCSLQTSYRFADWLVMWEIDDFVTLTSEQEEHLENYIEKTVYWHATRELPKIQADVQQMVAAIDQNTWNQTIDDYFWQSWTRVYFPVRDKLLNTTPTLLSQLTPAQIKELETNLAKRLEEDKEEDYSKSEEEYRKDRIKGMKKWMGRWLGDLTSAQEKAIEVYVDRMPLTLEQYYAYAKSWQSSFIQCIQKPKEAMNQCLTVLVTNGRETLAPAYAKIRKQKQEAWYQARFEIMQSMTAKQKAHLIDTLTDYDEDIQDVLEMDRFQLAKSK